MITGRLHDMDETEVFGKNFLDVLEEAVGARFEGEYESVIWIREMTRPRP